MTAPTSATAALTHYQVLGVSPWASAQEVRRAYRELCKRYHPDTSSLAPEVAKRKFQAIHEAYTTLTSPTQRFIYDQQAGNSPVPIVQMAARRSPSKTPRSEEGGLSERAYYSLTSRPLSPPEIVALCAMGLVLVLSLALVLVLSWSPV